MKRRQFIRKSTIGALGACFIGSMYAWQIEPYWLEFTHIKMPIKNLPKNLIGKKLMQISDIHVGNRMDHQYIIDSFKKAQLLQPDFVVYTGDYVSYEDEQQFKQLKKVCKYIVKGNLGTVGVLGNHDYGKNWVEQNVADEITGILEKSGVTILSNNETSIEGLNIIGLDDFWGLNFHPQKIMSQVDSHKANLVLCHNPDVCDLDVWYHYNSWILSGHTHGGQVKPPFLTPPILPVKNNKYTSGKINLTNGRTLYINRALGFLHQVRCNVRPEITIFELEEKL
ncbi:metallophosphoesterase [Polaribacter sp.]|uniref:metallophosphoesterase n=1 Tax=Polaribacter sp. TaxID=1920175 RepID=UPI003EF2D72E